MFGLFKKKAPELKPTLAEVEAKYGDEIGRLMAYAALMEPEDVPSRSRRGGGSALLPPDFAWPKYEGKPLLLLVQVDLAEATVAVPQLRDRFPATGVLQVFIDDGAEWCSDPLPDDEGPIQVYLHSADDLRTATGPGEPAQGTGIVFKSQKTLPDDFLLHQTATGEYEAFSGAYTCLGDQLGGWPNPIQNDPVGEENVLLLSITVHNDTLYITADPAALREGRLQNLSAENQFD